MTVTIEAWRITGQLEIDSYVGRWVEQAAGGVTVTGSEQSPGDGYVAGTAVARTTTATDGTFTVALVPGKYVVTAEAGMSCELMDVWVARDTFAKVDVPCDTGIR